MQNCRIMATLALLIAAEVSGQFEMNTLKIMPSRSSRILPSTVPSVDLLFDVNEDTTVRFQGSTDDFTTSYTTADRPEPPSTTLPPQTSPDPETQKGGRSTARPGGTATTTMISASSSLDQFQTEEDLQLAADSLNPVLSIADNSQFQGRQGDEGQGLLYTGRSSWDRIREVRRRSMNMTRVEHIEAECQDDFMRIIVHFNGSFDGLVYSAGYAYDPGCVYINGTGRSVYEFLIQLNRCGTLGGNNQRDVETRGREVPAKNFMWNTVSIQYNPMIEEEWDEHFKVTCEYGYDIWKTVTFPFLDVETQTGNPVVFTLSPPECYMEIRYGYGTTGNRITGPVRVGDPLTLLIYMRSQYDGFDIVVSDCYAHNGADKKITLVDHYGCPVDEKLISPFQGSWSDNGVFETQVYAYMKTFRFTGSPALYIECDVRMCHGACPTQPCHWRRGKRSVDELDRENRTIEQMPTQSVALFQSLEVLKDEELPEASENSASGRQAGEDSVCLKPSILLWLSSAAGLILLLSASSCCVLCLRMRHQKRNDKHVPVDAFRPPCLIRPTRLP